MKSWVDRALAILFSGFACPFVSLFFQWRADAGRLSDTQDRDAQVAALLKEVYTLRAMPAVVEDGPVREERILGMVSDALSQAGVNPSAMRDVGVEGQSGAGPGYRRQGIRVQLDPLILPDLGRFLSTWRQLHPSWIPAAVNLSSLQRGDLNGRENEELPNWSVAVVFACTYLENGGARAAAPARAMPPAEVTLR